MAWTQVRQRAGGAVISAVFESLAAAGRLHPKARPARYGIRVERDLDYTGSGARHHRLDVWLPPGEAAMRPAVLLVHGGGFRILSKDTHWIMALMLARAGYPVFTVNYRLAPAHPFPAGLEDVAAAWGWVLDHAADFGADPGRIAVAGESAGANLGLALTLAACFERPEPFARAVFGRGAVPAAVLPACGLLETSNPERYLARTELPTLFRDRIQVVCGAYLGALGTAPRPETDLANPLRVLESDVEPVRPLPPMYLCAGTGDPIFQDTVRLARALDQRGVSYTLDTYRGEPHAFHALVWREAAQSCWDAHREFLARWLSGGEATGAGGEATGAGGDTTGAGGEATGAGDDGSGLSNEHAGRSQQAEVADP